MLTLSPVKRRIVYVALFELLAIPLSTVVLILLSDGDTRESLPVAVIVSSAAIVWNYIYNMAFECWELRNNVVSRTLKIRCIHAAGFEAGLFLFCLPLYMLWYGVGLWTAITMEAALLIFFLIFTFFFTLIFDQVFTLHRHKTVGDGEDG